MTVTIDGTTGIASVDGSAGSPSVRGDDSNSGIYYGTDIIYMSTGGVQRWKLTDGGDIQVPDSCKFEWGGGQDLAIYHDGTNGYIKGQGSACGSIHIDNSADADQNIDIKAGQDIYLKTHDGSHTSIRCERGGGVYLYQNNSLRCQVIGNGFQIEANHHLGLPPGNWTGDGSCKIQGHSNHLYFCNPSNTGKWLFRLPSGTEPAQIDHNGTFGSSDERLKKDITTITNAVSIVKQLTGRSFAWKETDQKSFGVIAQEVEPVLPDLITTQSVPEGVTDTDPYKMVNYAALSGHFIEAIKELSAEVETLKTKVAALEAA